MALLCPVFQYLDGNGNPYANAKIYLYQAGTTTPLAGYTDSTGGTPLSNPVIADANGYAVIWLATTSNYKIVVHDQNDLPTVIPTIDNVSGIGNTLSFYSTLNTNLDTNGYSLITTSGNKNIPIIPNGTGQVQLTNAYFATPIKGSSNNNILTFTDGVGNTDYLNIQNSISGTGNYPGITSTGSSTDIGFDYIPKGIGTFNFRGNTSGPAKIKLFETTTNGQNSVGIKPPASVAADYYVTLPPDGGTTGYFAKTDGTGTITWTDTFTGNGSGGAFKLNNNSSALAGSLRFYDKSASSNNYLEFSTNINITASKTWTWDPAEPSSGTYPLMITRSVSTGIMTLRPAGYTSRRDVTGGPTIGEITSLPMSITDISALKVIVSGTPATDGATIQLQIDQSGTYITGASDYKRVSTNTDGTTVTTATATTTFLDICGGVGCGSASPKSFMSEILFIQGNSRITALGKYTVTTSAGVLNQGTFSAVIASGGSTANLSSVTKLKVLASSGNCSPVILATPIAGVLVP